MSQEGYVYILTNPSFREDWVKIGKSSRPVDVRSKELDNTAVPLPFEIYATIRTVKYSKVEKLIHKTIDRLTDLRIRQNREFFNVKPEMALDILRDIAETLDDAEITVYRNGVPVTQANENTGKEDTNEVAGKFGGQKDRFWQGFISYATADRELNDTFSLRSKVPYSHHAYDISVGTTLCNIFLLANRSRLQAGLYFHGKEAFNALLSRKEDIEAIIEDTVEWNEFEKDAAIVNHTGLDLSDESSYSKAYDWLKRYCLRYHRVVNELVVNPGASVANETEGQEEFVPRTHRERFKFSMISLTVGDMITFVPTGVQVRVASDDQVEYQGRLYKLSPFVGTFMPADKRNTSGSYQGAKYFSYKGEVLDNIRKKIESENAE